ncbi:MAG: right-handed parallel beta-helix repeat-containing protein [Lentisphaeria bacterium]|nr:right-handed parallel beta-helix repeat-containing protein [Lentisphaeria bacterium]
MKKIFNVAEYNVKPDRPDIIQTEAIQKVIDIAAENGGTVYFPQGNYSSGSLFFKKNTSLFLEKNAFLQGSTDISDFAILPNRMEGENVIYFAALINADNVDDFSISGEGTLDGNGLPYWRHFWLRRKFNPQCTNMDEMRPRIIYISNSNNVHISGITIQNSPFWTTHFYRCSNLLLENLRIFAPTKPVLAPSSDAIDLDVCSDVLIKNCYISVNDDAIALKGGKGPDADKLPENGENSRIVIENCTFGFCHCILTCGSETIHNDNIIVRNCTSDGAACLFSLKMRPDTNQLSENILIENIKGYCKRIFSSYSFTQFRRSPDLHMSYGKNITLQNLDLKCDKLVSAEKSIEYELENIRFTNCNFICPEKLQIDFNDGKDFIIENVKISAD